VYNRTPVKRLKNKTPFEMLNSVKPDLSHLRIMGCGAYVFLHEDVRHDKMSPHAEFMTFIGFTDGIKGWKFMRSTNAIFLATKAVFNENTFPRCPDDSRANIPAIESSVLRSGSVRFFFHFWLKPEPEPTTLLSELLKSRTGPYATGS
jgi:hypothetical protein